MNFRRQKQSVLAVGMLLALAGCVHLRAGAGTGYLTGHEVDFRSVLAPPPSVDSPWDHADEQLVEALQSVDEARLKSAKLDENDLYPRFAAAFGSPIDRTTSPILTQMLDRAIVDVEATASAAKDHFRRPRPYQRLQLQHLCAKPIAPKPEDHPTHGNSYPSGHS